MLKNLSLENFDDRLFVWIEFKFVEIWLVNFYLIYIYIYKTEAFEALTIFHVTTIFFSFYFRFYILYIYYNSLV